MLHDKTAFKERLIAECEKSPTRPLLTQTELEQKAASVYGETPTTEGTLPLLQDAAFLDCETDVILSRRIIGKSDVDIAALIQKLGSSDWVKQGVSYLSGAEGVCPFCQQRAPDQLATSLAEYFDETFLKETATLNALAEGYKLEGERLQQTLRQFAAASPRFLDLDKIGAEKSVFDARFALNLQRIASKVREPSVIVSLEPLGEVLRALRELVTVANEKITAHNAMVANLTVERNKLSGDVWAFLAHSEIVSAYRGYRILKSGVEKAIQSLGAQVALAHENRRNRELTIEKLEKTVTSIQPTVDAINRLLRNFGFRSFYLEVINGNLYRLCRPDGSDAQDTLSEGERSFITFLYFFHLSKGSTSETGLNTDRVVVFDDPVSSLDSDVLFIVSSLIKQTIEEARAQSGCVKQVFILTHNVYFHKEVVFDGIRSGDTARGDETFWTIRKVNGISSVQRHNRNPIKNSYELLWAPLRNPNFSDQCLQNNMRRILEHYFRILGGISFEEILDEFDGEEKLICRSLLSWAHDGSHSISDDIFHTLNESAMQRYIAVFRDVFTKMRQSNHYNMMMGPPYVITAET